MHIALFSRELPSDHRNGVSIQVHRLAEALVLRGHAVTVCSFSPKPAGAAYAHHLCRWRSRGHFFRLVETAVVFRSLARSLQADVCHFHGDDWLVRGSSRRVRTFHGSAFFEALHARSIRRRLRQIFLYVCEIASAVRRGTLTSVSASAFAVLPRGGIVVPCGIPLDRYRSEGMRSKRPSVLFVGDLDSRKRGRFLCEVFQSRVRLSLPDVELVVVGPQEVEGPGIRWIGTVSEETLIEEYRRAWVLCLPSSYEGFGVPVIEAMAGGAVVVATPSAGVREVLTHAVSGIFASDQEFGEALISVLSDSALRERLVAGGAATASRYRIEDMAERYEKLYRAAAEGR